MKEKLIIINGFFDTIAFFISFLLSFFRSFKLFFLSGIKKNNVFFNFLDFIFRNWSKYFWRKPTFYKLFSSIGDFVHFIFKTK